MAFAKIRYVGLLVGLGLAACGSRVGQGDGTDGGNADAADETSGGSSCANALDPSRWTQTLSAGRQRTCHIRNGTPVCWGDSQDAGPIPGGNFAQISTTGPTSECGLTVDGVPVCWGAEWPGHLLPIPEGEFESVHAAAMFSQGFACALPKGGGPIECFGDWGDPNPVDEPWVQLTAGTGIVCGLTASCEPQCLGGAPGTRPPDGARFVQLAASSRQRCGVHFDGTVECWGYDGFDHLYYEPFGDDLFTRVSVGDWLICGLRTDGTLACIPSPEAEDSDVPDPPDGAFAEVSIGRTHACALGLDDEVVCWGSNDMGESSPP